MLEALLLATLVTPASGAPPCLAHATATAARTPQGAPAKSRRDEVRERYRALHEERDEGGLAELWRAHQDLILAVLYEDLEAGLAVWGEAPDEHDQERIDALYQRALFGARVASSGAGLPLVHDYVAAFVGWDADEREAFRVEQAIYERALAELEKPELDPSRGEALVAREVWERALHLGDWWGAALGFEVEGRAHERGGFHAEALLSYSQARLVFHQLGLLGSELTVLRSMVDLCAALERWQRSRALAADALILARRLERGEVVRELLLRRARAEQALGDDAAAAESARELEALDG